MKESGQSRVIRTLCLLLFLYEISTIFRTGARVMLPNFVYSDSSKGTVMERIVNEQAYYFLPAYARFEENVVKEKRKDVFRIKKLESGEMLTLMDLENSSLGYEVTGAGLKEKEEDTGQEGLSIESDLLEEMMLENQQTEGVNGTQAPGKSESAENTGSSGQKPVTGTDFLKHQKMVTVDLKDLEDYETLVKKFYTIDAITIIGAEELNAQKLGNMDMTMKQTADAPQILIYHTHSQEGYADSVAGDDSTTIMGVGEHLKEILEQEYGYHVIHHLGKYDVETRDSAYSRSLPEISKLLEENPTIEVVIDLHRDAVADENTKLVTNLDGRPTAKFMFFNGISRTRSTGKISYLQNENLEANLAFSFQMKWRAEEYYPGLTRRNYLNAYRYNMHLCPKTLLIELGAQNNTLEEAMNACDPIAHLLHIVLSGEE